MSQGSEIGTLTRLQA